VVSFFANTKHSNCEAVFGRVLLLWLLPIDTCPSTGWDLPDGTQQENEAHLALVHAHSSSSAERMLASSSSEGEWEDTGLSSDNRRKEWFGGVGEGSQAQAYLKAQSRQAFLSLQQRSSEQEEKQVEMMRHGPAKASAVPGAARCQN
jgi:hypothetical protein